MNMKNHTVDMVLKINKTLAYQVIFKEATIKYQIKKQFNQMVL